MLWLYIVAGIIALLLILLFLPVVISLDYKNEQFTARAGYVFAFKKIKNEKKPGKQSSIIKIYNLLSGGKKSPDKEKNDGKATSGSSGESIASRLKTAVKNNGIGPVVSNICNLALAAFTGLGKLANHIKIRRFSLNIVFGGKDDPAAAALSYGETSTVLGTSLGILSELIRFRSHRINLNCNYNTNESAFNGHINIYVSPVFIISALIKFITDYTARKTYYARRAAARKKAAARRKKQIKK